MKPTKSLLFLMAILLTNCQKPTRDNPWDELAEIDPQSWAPKNLRIESPTINQRTISWDYSGDDRIEGFKIDRKRGGESWISSYMDVPKLGRNLTDTITLEPAIDYQYRIYAFAGKNKSGVADTAFYGTIPPPEYLTFTVNSPTSITLIWVYTSSGHEGFQIERKTNQEAWSVIAQNIVSEATNYTDTQIILELNNYSYRMRAYSQNIFSNYTSQVSVLYKTVISPATGKIWMDRNLGANRIAHNSSDAIGFGDLYQWGRNSDGHQKRTSATSSVLSSSDTPEHGNFILAPNYPYDWRSPHNHSFWQGVNGINNPCPHGFRLPTIAEWNAERESWTSNDAAGAFNSPLKLPVAGYRVHSDGSLYSAGSIGYYWSATVRDSLAQYIYFGSSAADVSSDYRGRGFSVRCIKD